MVYPFFHRREHESAKFTQSISAKSLFSQALCGDFFKPKQYSDFRIFSA